MDAAVGAVKGECVNIVNARYRRYYRASSVEAICFVENSRLAWNRF